jgi:hypothetical protein
MGWDGMGWDGMGWDGMEWNVVESDVLVQEKAVFTWNARGNSTDSNNARGTSAASGQRGKVQLGRTSSPCFRRHLRRSRPCGRAGL